MSRAYMFSTVKAERVLLLRQSVRVCRQYCSELHQQSVANERACTKLGPHNTSSWSLETCAICRQQASRHHHTWCLARDP